MTSPRQAILEAYLADEDEILFGLIRKARMTGAEQAATAALARTLIATGMPPHTPLLLADARRYFPENEELQTEDPFPLEMLAKQRLASEKQN